MKLVFTGIGAAYYPQLGSNCAFFVHNNHLFLIDCGESTFGKMAARKEIYDYEHITILLTHLHMDHIGSLGSFLSFCKNVLKKKVRVIAEEDTIVHILSMCGIPPESYEFTTNFQECEKVGLFVTPHRAAHATDMLCCGFTLSDGIDTIFFSGDTSVLSNEILEQFLSGKIQIMYHECSFLEQDSPSHTSLEKLKQWIPEQARNRVYCMHFGGDYKEAVKASGFQIPDVV